MPDGRLQSSDIDTATRMLDHVRDWKPCIRCHIGKRAHHKVFARGTLPCEVLFVGEAPGKTEDVVGYPFVGQSGRLLDEWIGAAGQEICKAAGLEDLTNTPFSWAITNTLLCRPCEVVGGPNRAPILEEILNCRPRLEYFIRELAKPQAIVTLGRFAAEEIPEWNGLPVLAIKHPAWVLRQGGAGSTASVNEIERLTQFLMEIIG
jgi:uracil-DNA glycosylase family 4